MTIFRRAWSMQLQPGAEVAYDAAHAAIWPELTEQMVADGIIRFHLFRSGLTVFAVQERRTPFPDNDSKPSEITRKWWQRMAPIMVTDTDGRPLREELTEVFALNPERTRKDSQR